MHMYLTNLIHRCTIPPSNPLQPGLIYFLTPRKDALFGICEAIPRQVNYFIDEASDTGKGANTVVSMLDYYFDQHGLGEKTATLHAHNCFGHKYNIMMMQYLMWRVITGLHDSITTLFLIIGQTKFAPDSCFGLLNRVSEDTGQLSSRPRTGSSVLGYCERVTASRQLDWRIYCSNEGLDRLPWTTLSATDRDKALPSLPV